MHPASTMKQWIHHLHDISLLHEIFRPFHSANLWAWVGLAMLLTGLLMMYLQIGVP